MIKLSIQLRGSYIQYFRNISTETTTVRSALVDRWRFISFISMITLINEIKTENKMNINYLGNNKIKSPQTSQIRYQINFIPMKISASTVSLIYLLHKHGGLGIVCLKKKTSSRSN